MKRELQRIEPWSAVRVGFFLGIPVGFLLGLLEAAFFKSLSGHPNLLPPEASTVSDLSGGGVFVMAVVMSLVCSLFFALGGGLGAMIYNLIARLFGGIEMHLSGESEHSAAGMSHESHEDDEHV